MSNIEHAKSFADGKLDTHNRDVDRIRSELEFERQCNSELGRRNRKYLKLIDRFDAHRAEMEAKLSDLLNKVNLLSEIAASGNLSFAVLCPSLFCD